MKIEFKKISETGIDFEIKKENIKFFGIAKKIDKNLVKCFGILKGSFTHSCDRCGCDFEQSLNYEIEIYASDGIYKDDEYINVIEFFGGFVNFDTMLRSEIESLKCDYLYCDQCK